MDSEFVLVGVSEAVSSSSSPYAHVKARTVITIRIR
jgi:hypothetical protein